MFTVRWEPSSLSPNPDFLLRGARLLPPSAGIGPGRAVLWSSCAILLGQTCCLPVTATTDVLAPDILNKCGLAVQAIVHAPQQATGTAQRAKVGEPSSWATPRRRAKITSPQMASVLVGAGVSSVLMFPTIAGHLLHQRESRAG